jgi:hypothetical protein
MVVKDILDKLSSYNLFNYLFPGAVFAILLSATTGFTGSLDFDLSTVILIYFIGLIISRIGSLVIEEILLKFNLCKLINTKLLFKKFKGNIKLEIIHEAMNMYRTLAAMSFSLAVVTLIDVVFYSGFNWDSIVWIVAEVSVSVLFICAFNKQRNKVLECLTSSEPS